jgi:endonuclease/exonuclease/phosphatase family metal-dependent hydrolase
VPTAASLLVRTWNVAHGRDRPPAGDTHVHLRRKLLREMAALVTADRPQLVLLQEMPAWAGRLLCRVTGMAVAGAVAYGAHVPFLHLPLPLRLGGAFARAFPDVARSQFEGQANALLYDGSLELVAHRREPLDRRRRLRGEPRIAQLARLRHRASGRQLAVANVHAFSGLAAEHLGCAARLLEEFAVGAPMLLGGDLNAHPRSPALRSLREAGWHGAAPSGIDHLLLRGLAVERVAARWPPERRDVDVPGRGRVRLSDHDPVDLVVGLP